MKEVQPDPTAAADGQPIMYLFDQAMVAPRTPAERIAHKARMSRAQSKARQEFEDFQAVRRMRATLAQAKRERAEIAALEASEASQ